MQNKNRPMTHTVLFFLSLFFFWLMLLVDSQPDFRGSRSEKAVSLCCSPQEILTPQMVIGVNSSAAYPSEPGRGLIKGPFACCLWEAGGKGQPGFCGTWPVLSGSHQPQLLSSEAQTCSPAGSVLGPTAHLNITKFCASHLSLPTQL